MRRIICLTIAILLCALTAYADTAATTANNDRRIEEKDRTSLQSTEAPSAAIDITAVKPPKETINKKFYNRLIDQRTARKVDGVYVVMVLLGKQSDFKTFAEELTFLKENGFIPKSKIEWDLQEPLRKDELAFMLFKTLKINGGLHIRIFGVSPRYALLELIYQKIMFAGGPKEFVSGRELAATFIRAADHLHRSLDDDKN